MDKRTSAIVLAVLAVVLACGTVVLAVGLWGGATWLRAQVDDGSGAWMGAWGRDDMPFGRAWGPGMMWGEGRGAEQMPCGEYGAGPGIMWDDGQMPCDEGCAIPGDSGTLSLEDAEAAVTRYVAELGYDGLHVTEVMEFERNFYAIVAEEDTGIGAMELLVDKGSGAVGPEPGPNMMWNARYGMHGGGRGGMMGGYATGEMRLTPAEAEAVAQEWLDANLPGRMAGEADAFYGYYTLHFLRDGRIEGMLSIHGVSGQVWYHSWHGEFIAMTGEHD